MLGLPLSFLKNPTRSSVSRLWFFSSQLRQAFGVAKKTTLNVYELLKAVDRQAVLGVLYNDDPTLQKQGNHLLHALNVAGSIS